LETRNLRLMILIHENQDVYQVHNLPDQVQIGFTQTNARFAVNTESNIKVKGTHRITSQPLTQLTQSKPLQKAKMKRCSTKLNI